jgi:hypothetical protein
MPIAQMAVPAAEHDPAVRLVAKIENLLDFAYKKRGAVRGEAQGADIQIGGEMYECVCAHHFIGKNVIRDGDEFGRWDDFYQTGGEQSVYPVMNREKDFIFRAGNKLAANFIGEAKSYSGGVGSYIKQCAQICLMDLRGQLGGFIFITPGDNYLLFLNIVFNVFEFVKTDSQAGAVFADAKTEINRDYPNLATHNYMQIFQNSAADRAAIPVVPRTQQKHGRTVQLPYGLNENRRKVAVHLNAELQRLLGIKVEAVRVAAQPKAALQQMWTDYMQRVEVQAAARMDAGQVAGAIAGMRLG